MSYLDKARLSSLGGLARRREKRGSTLSVRIERSKRASFVAGRRDTAMQKVRAVWRHAYCLASSVDGRFCYVVFASGGVLGAGTTPRSAWEAALKETLAKALTE